jgi:hypothetical protein
MCILILAPGIVCLLCAGDQRFFCQYVPKVEKDRHGFDICPNIAGSFVKYAPRGCRIVDAKGQRWNHVFARGRLSEQCDVATRTGKIRFVTFVTYTWYTPY